LIVVEGADGSGRSTQIARLVTGWKRAGTPRCSRPQTLTLVSAELEKAQDGTF